MSQSIVTQIVEQAHDRLEALTKSMLEILNDG